MANLTDKEVLNAIFNPLLPLGELVYEEDEDSLNRDENDEEESEQTNEAKQLEVAGVKLAETGDLPGALQLFSKAIEVAPSRASGYNNRAQTLRLLGKIDEAQTDLNNAINLSNGKGRAACQAYCQRGLLYLRNNSVDSAKADFEEASKLGSQFAKAQLVQMNPYAALCNKMLKSVFTKLQNGESTNEEDVTQGKQ
ncbi:unnamed protein product [Orchesella dallaii]|uniref:Tetratricopeptide repeat protein 36 n=1 Tax=Orchesella dallaii TaxID=48710 RepID=A0ABP1PPR9_9HEXA